MAKAAGRIQALEAFKGTTETALTKLSEADAKLLAAITALDGKVAVGRAT